MEVASMWISIQKQLETQEIVYKLHTHVVSRTVADAEQFLPFPRELLLKTVLFRIRKDYWVFVALRGADQVDYRKLAVVLGEKRSDLKRPTAEEIEAVSGYEIGGVGPFPWDEKSVVYFDQRTLTLDQVYCGSGRNDVTLEIALKDLLTLSHAVVADLAREEV